MSAMDPDDRNAQHDDELVSHRIHARAAGKFEYLPNEHPVSKLHKKQDEAEISERLKKFSGIKEHQQPHWKN